MISPLGSISDITYLFDFSSALFSIDFFGFDLVSSGTARSNFWDFCASDRGRPATFLDCTSSFASMSGIESMPIFFKKSMSGPSLPQLLQTPDMVVMLRMQVGMLPPIPPHVVPKGQTRVTPSPNGSHSTCFRSSLIKMSLSCVVFSIASSCC